jgi:hypothetical protein
MAKDKKDKGPPKGETPFQRFERLAKALVAVPKERIRDREDDVSEKR